jgi:chromosome segregation ATPase
MEEKDNTPFRIRFDDDTAEEAENREGPPLPFSHDGRLDAADDSLSITRLSRRVTIIAVLMPLVTVGLVVFAYVNINKNLASSTAEGMANYKQLSQDLEKSLSDLSVKSEALKDAVDTETRSFEKKTDLFTKSLNKNAAEIKNLNKQISALKTTDESKIDKKELQTSVSRLDNKIEALKSELASMTSDQRGFKLEMKKELEALQDAHGALFEVLQKLKVDMVSLSESQITEDKLDNALQRQNEKYKHALEVVSEKFEHRLSEVENIQKHSQQPVKPQNTPDNSNLTETDLSG